MSKWECRKLTLIFSHHPRCEHVTNQISIYINQRILPEIWIYVNLSTYPRKRFSRFLSCASLASCSVSNNWVSSFEWFDPLPCRIIITIILVKCEYRSCDIGTTTKGETMSEEERRGEDESDKVTPLRLIGYLCRVVVAFGTISSCRSDTRWWVD